MSQTEMGGISQKANYGCCLVAPSTPSASAHPSNAQAVRSCLQVPRCAAHEANQVCHRVRLPSLTQQLRCAVLQPTRNGL